MALWESKIEWFLTYIKTFLILIKTHPISKKAAKNISKHPIMYSKIILDVCISKSLCPLNCMRKLIVIAKIPIEQNTPAMKLLKGSLHTNTP